MMSKRIRRNRRGVKAEVIVRRKLIRFRLFVEKSRFLQEIKKVVQISSQMHRSTSKCAGIHLKSLNHKFLKAIKKAKGSPKALPSSSIEVITLPFPSKMICLKCKINKRKRGTGK